MAGRSGGPPAREYPLKSFHNELEEHNIMMMPERADFSFKQLVPPVKMYRRKPSWSEEANGEGTQGMDREASPKDADAIGGASMKKKKTQIMKEWLTSEERQERDLEEQTWHLEDAEGRGWTGKLEGGISSRKTSTGKSRYVIFVNQGKDFRVIPIKKWYKFTQKISYPTLGLEEAEAKVTEKQKLFASDRWMMHQRRNEEGNGGKIASLRHDMMRENIERGDWEMVPLIERKMRLKEADEFAEKMDLEFDEVFEDDEEQDMNEDMEDETAASRKAKANRRPNMPSALAGMSAFELEDFDVDDTAAYSRARSTGVFPQKVPPVTPSPDIIKPLLESPSASIPIIKKIKINPPTNQYQELQAVVSPVSSISSFGASPSITPVQHVGSPDPTLLITEADIVAELRKRPMPTKELISLLKPKLKAHPQNKDLFRTFLKKLATVKASENEQDRLLELKDEFKWFTNENTNIIDNFTSIT